ncbi:hypothetical protein LSH36_54g00010 [Paralvinella palmiformis]|uniref:Uncharacterized protein n=1 Tax=Paralvinella palmiformis TaxID=53620 RepID=A0AAD9K5H8_9ANNE|nr:hypothetical protein LSH36_54g00010 [Paralvinella palmiformis]
MLYAWPAGVLNDRGVESSLRVLGIDGFVTAVLQANVAANYGSWRGVSREHLMHNGKRRL